jgi:hypothetical protein
MSTRRLRFFLIQFVLVIGAACVADITVGHMDIDTEVMNKALYYQTVEIEVHTPVDDPVLLYALQPGSRLGGEGPWGLRTVSVNRFGARSPSYTEAKTPGTRRTLVFGGSTLYGAGVSNHQTTPGVMDALLGDRHEVWNFGVCAYNTAQSARLANRMLRSLKPELIVIMITNTGRRAFMGGPEHENDDKTKYFNNNPALYLENFPPTSVSEPLHFFLIQHSALYRTWAGTERLKTNPDTTYADKADRTQVALLEEAAAELGVDVLYVLSPSRGSEIGAGNMGVPSNRWIDLNQRGREADYSQAHPSPAVLAEYAQAIVNEMKERGFTRD